MTAESISSRTRLHHEVTRPARRQRAAERILRAALRLGLALVAHASLATVTAHGQLAAAPPPPDAAPPSSPELAAEPSPSSASPDPRAEPFVILPIAAPAQRASTPPPPRDALDDEAPPREDDEREWYGWQTLSVDGAALAFVVGGSASGSAGASLFGLGGYLLATPIVHAVHRNSWALPSLGMRVGSVGLLVLGSLVTFGGCFTLGEEDPPGCGSAQTVGGVLVVTGLVGTFGSIALDAVLARSRPAPSGAPSLGLWGDPLAGVAGVSVTVVR